MPPARAFARPRISSCIAIPIARRWDPPFSRECPRNSTSSTRRSWSPRRSAWASPSRIPRGHRVFSIELGNGASVDGLPGVPGGSGYVGTFDREEAVENESIDFFASGHPLVEGIFAHYEESPTRPRGAVPDHHGPGQRRRAGRHLQGRPGIRGGRARRRRQARGGLGRGGPAATHSRPPVLQVGEHDGWRSMVRSWANAWTRPVVSRRSRHRVRPRRPVTAQLRYATRAACMPWRPSSSDPTLGHRLAGQRRRVNGPAPGARALARSCSPGPAACPR